MSDLIEVPRARFVDIVRHNVALWSTFAIEDSVQSTMQYIDDRDGSVQAQAIYPAPVERYALAVIPVYMVRVDAFEASCIRETEA